VSSDRFLIMINRLQNFQHSIDHGPPKHRNDSLASRRSYTADPVLTRSRTTCALPHGAHGIVVCGLDRVASIIGVRQQRQQEVNSFELSAAVDAQAAEISALRGMVSTMMGADSPVTATVQAIATDMTARTMGLMSTATSNDERLGAVAGSLASLTSEVDAQLDAAAASTAAAQAAMTATLTATTQSSEDEAPHRSRFRLSCHLSSLTMQWMPVAIPG